MVDVFERAGFGQWLRYLTALLESGAPRCSLGRRRRHLELLLATVSVRAFVAQLLVLHEDILHTMVLALVLGAIVWTHRDQFRIRQS